jgi:autotransporter strand-loop-strand O-heptosyltransferase
MKIVNVTPGLLPIPPNGWGAVEKIIWETHLELEKLGHESIICYLNDVPKDADIVHIHVANLANMAHEQGIKYFFTMHDHHAYLYGKDSPVYEQNLKAIKNAQKAFVPAKYLVEWFENVPEYLSHSVNTNIFFPNNENIKHNLLCVANNGFIHDPSEDRKGFGYAIEAARILNMPITIAGPENNRRYFEKHPPNYHNLTIKYNLSEEELIKLYSEHTIFISPSVLEAGHPNLTLLEAMASGLPTLSTFEPNNNLNGLTIIERNAENIANAIKETINNYEAIRSKCIQTANNLSYKNIDKYKHSQTMIEQLNKIYETTEINKVNYIHRDNYVSYSFVNGPKVEILGNVNEEYDVEFINLDNNELVYKSRIRNNSWSKATREIYTNWHIKVYRNNQLFSEHIFNPTGKKVYIAIESGAVGDTIAWMPMAEEFRKKHNCELVLSTFHNEWFEKEYSEIKFIKPGEVVYDLYAMFKIGWYYKNNEIDYGRIPFNFREFNLQYTASMILNLENKEVKPRIHVKNKNRTIDGKYVIIAPHASAKAKYWNHPNGWQSVVNHLNNNGYKVVLMSNEKYGDNYHDAKIAENKLYGVIDRTGSTPLEEKFGDILNADMLIGVGSGLSWVSWSLGTKTMLISGFSYPYSEFSDCIRIESNSNCAGCFNRHKLDPSDWNWCPDHKDTPRMFECTKSITPEMVIEKINKALFI